MLHVLLFLLSLVASSSSFGDPLVKHETEDFSGGLYQIGDLYLSGQPKSVAALQSLVDQGVTTVINLRAPKEMESEDHPLPNEQETVSELGVEYIHLPSGGEDHPMLPATVKKFAEIMSNAEGKVLLHCGSSRRATHLWVAYLTEYQDVPLDEAIRRGRQANFGESPLEQFLSQPIQYQLQE